MNKFIPKSYKKSIFDIDYDSLQKKHKIKVLLFDFDNTIIAHKKYEIDKKTIELFEKLSKNFIVYIVSNSVNTKKLSAICQKLNVPYIGASMKPLTRGFKKLKLRTNSNQIAMIGDQIMTDVYGGNKMGYHTILIDPINEKTEIIFTKINRKLEKLIKNKVKKGAYYD